MCHLVSNLGHVGAGNWTDLCVEVPDFGWRVRGSGCAGVQDSAGGCVYHLAGALWESDYNISVI